MRVRISRSQVNHSITFQKLWRLQYLFLAFGILALGYYGYVTADSYVYQDYENWAFDQELAGKSATGFQYVEHFLRREPRSSGDADLATTEPALPPWVNPDSRPEANSKGDRTDEPKEVDARRSTHSAQQAGDLNSMGLVGRVEVKRLHISAIVREGTDTRTLRRAVGHVTGTALPGQIGNCAIAAHRDTFFRNLRDVRKGDTIQVTTMAGIYLYRVESLKIVRPSAVEVLAASAEPVITLVTCYPFNYVGSAPKRFIVRGVLEGRAEGGGKQGS